MNHSYEDTAECLSVISNESRLEMIRLLEKKPLTLSEVSGICGISTQNARKHLGILEKNLFVKNKDAKFFLSPFGYAISKQLGTVEFFEKNREYFVEHELGDTPAELVSLLGMLKSSELVRGFPPSLARWSRLIQSAKSYVYCLFTQPPINIADDIKEKIDQGCQIRILFGKNTKIPDSSEFVNNLELKKLGRSEKIERRICNEVRVNAIISESQASLMFPSRGGQFDIHHCLFSDSSDFLKWCLYLYDHKWKNATPFARLRN